MRVQTEEWRRFIPGMRMYKGKMTLFYNGEKLRKDGGSEYFVYNKDERKSWVVIIVLPGVEIIPAYTFCGCNNVETVIMSDTVRRIKFLAFYCCKSLEFVRLSRNLEYIGDSAFMSCYSLTSIFIPESCREMDEWVFGGCRKLIILSVPHHTRLGENVIDGTALFEASPFETNEDGYYDNSNEVNAWIRNRHADNQFSLHRACTSYNPLEEVIFEIIRRQGLKAFKQPDSVGVTASQYLLENPYTEIKEQKMINRYILDLMGEVV